MKHVKTVPATYSVKAEEEGGGWIVEGYASVFESEPDSYGDIVYKGAFNKTLKERLPRSKVRFFWEHSTPLGVPLSVEEDDYGLKVRARISKTALGADVKTLVEDGAVGDFSFGYDLPGDKNKPNAHGGLDIHEVRLYEFSLVGIGAADDAVLTGVKSLASDQAAIRAELESLKNLAPDAKESGVDTEEQKAASDLPLASEETSWDGPAAMKALAEWATEDGETNYSKMSQGFFWSAPAPESQDDLKLPFTTVDGDSLKAVPAGVKAAAGAVQGARGNPPDIPEADVAGVKAKIGAYYAKMDEEPPWAEDSKEEEPDEEKSSDMPTEEEVEKAISVFQALARGLEPSDDTPADDEPPKEDDADLEKEFRAELDAMRSL